jgi:AraC-like DNA-binding protein
MAWQESSTEFVDMVLHIPSDLESRTGISVLKAGRNRAKPSYKAGPRFAPYYSLHAVLRGELLVTYRGNQVLLHAGDLFCMYPHEAYEYQIHPGTAGLQLSWLAFKGQLADAQLQQTLLSAQYPFIRKGASRELISTMHSLRGLISQQQAEQSLLITSKLLLFLHALVEAANQQPAADRPEQPLWLTRSKLYMDIHFAEGITIEQVSDWLDLSRSHFSKSFHRHTGISPNHYLQALRMEEAKKRLAETSYSITEIAHSLGYADLFTFTRAFVRYYGLPPRDFRAKEACHPL